MLTLNPGLHSERELSKYVLVLTCIDCSHFILAMFEEKTYSPDRSFDRKRILYADESKERSREVKCELECYGIEVVLVEQIEASHPRHCPLPTYFDAVFLSLDFRTNYPCCGPTLYFGLANGSLELISSLRATPLFWFPANDKHNFSSVPIRYGKRLAIDNHRSVGQHILGKFQRLYESNTSAIILPLPDDEALLSFVSNPELLRAMNWRDFEKLLAHTLERLGYHVELRSGTKDGGIDVIAIRKDSVFGAHRYLIQAKHYSNPVGISAVRELLFVHDHERATKSCLVTTSRFTQGAWQLAGEYNSRLELRDREGLMEWIAHAIKNAPNIPSNKP